MNELSQDTEDYGYKSGKWSYITHQVLARASVQLSYTLGTEQWHSYLRQPYWHINTITNKYT